MAVRLDRGWLPLALVSLNIHVPRRTLRLLAAVFLGAFGVLLTNGPSTVSAENGIVSSEPANGAELTAQPTAIVTTFENEAGPGTDVVMACDNNPFGGIGEPSVSDDGTVFTVAVTQALPAGECNVTWTMTAADGSDDGSLNFSFVVGDGAAAATPGAAAGATTVAAETAADDANDNDSDIRSASSVSSAPIWLGRILSIVGLSVLFGSLVLIVAAWPEGPEYVLALRFLRSAWIVGLVGTVIYVAALSAAVKDESFGSGFNPANWFDLFDAGWGGRAAVMRIVFVVASGWVVLKPERVIDPTTNMLALGIPALAVLTLGLSRTGGNLAFLGVLASLVHVLAMAVWFGGAVLLARVVLAGPGEEDLVHAVRGFGRISNPAIIATVVSGIIQLYRQVGGDLFTTGHGRVLMVKTVGVAGMIFVGMTARQIARAKLTRASELSVKTADRLRRAFATEAAIGLVVIALTGWLLTLDPGKVPDNDGDFAVRETITEDTLDFEVDVFLSPGRIGLNDIRVEVTRPETGLSGLVLTFYPPDGSGRGPISQPVALTSAGIAASGPGGGVPFDVAGTWRLEVTAITPLGQVPATSTGFGIRDEDGDLPPVGNADLPAPPNTASTTQPTAPPTAAATTEG